MVGGIGGGGGKGVCSSGGLGGGGGTGGGELGGTGVGGALGDCGSSRDGGGGGGVMEGLYNGASLHQGEHDSMHKQILRAISSSTQLKQNSRCCQSCAEDTQYIKAPPSNVQLPG